MREKYIAIAEALKERLERPDELETIWRDDGTPWWVYSRRKARPERFVGNHIVIRVYEDEKEIISFGALATEPNFVAENLAQVFRRDIV